MPKKQPVEKVTTSSKKKAVKKKERVTKKTTAPKASTTNPFKKLFKQIEIETAAGGVVLLLVKSEDYVRVNNELLKHMVNKEKLAGVYVTLNRPYSTLVNTLKAKGVQTENIFFIDMITRSSGGESTETTNCLFVRSPENLTELSISLGEAVAMEKDRKKFIFLDSLSTMLIYNASGTVTKFAHFLTSKMRLWGVSGVIVSLEDETDPELKSQLSQFCDTVIKVNEGGNK